MRRVLRIEFEDACHHGSGFGKAGCADRTVLRDGAGMPYLAGSAIKGRLRHAAVRVLLARKAGKVCQYGDAKGACTGEEPCPVCRLFGSPVRAGGLRFGDAYPTGDVELVLRSIQQAGRGAGLPGDSTVRTSTAVDRRRGVVKEQLLFSTETLPAGLVFEGAVSGEMEAEEERLLREACRVLTHFGADGARGLGRCTWKLREES